MKQLRQCLAVAALALWAAAAVAQDIALPPAERIRLDNGAVLLLVEKPDVPLVAIDVLIRGGAVTDPAGKHGVASLYADLMQRGAGNRDAAEFAEAIDAVGGRLRVHAGAESINVWGDFLARDAELMVELVADMLLRPRLERSEFEKLRTRQINFILAAKDSDPGQLMPTYADAFLFGEHPYAYPLSGDETSLAAIRYADVRAWQAQQLGGDRLIVVVAGDFDADAMREKLRAAFSDWAPATAALPEVPAAERIGGRRVLLVDKPGATQSYFWIGNVGVSRYYPERAALDVVNTLFGGRFTSMLNNALRVESGLTYGARSRLTRPTQPGTVAISSYTETSTTVEAIDMALGLLDTLHADGVSETMVRSARNYILGQFPDRLETAAQLASEFAELEFYGQPADYIDGYGAAISAVTPESARAVIAEVYPPSDDLVFVILGDAEAIREAINKYGPVTETSITEPRFSVSDN